MSQEVIVDAIIGAQVRLIRVGNLSADKITRVVLKNSAAKAFLSIETIEPGKTVALPLPPGHGLVQVSIEYEHRAEKRQFTVNSLL